MVVAWKPSRLKHRHALSSTCRRRPAATCSLSRGMPPPYRQVKTKRSFAFQCAMSLGSKAGTPAPKTATPSPGEESLMPAPAAKGLHHVKLLVSDLDASLAWYARVLGAQHQAQFDHFDERGQRWAPHAATAMDGYDPISFAAGRGDDVQSWAAHWTKKASPTRRSARARPARCWCSPPRTAPSCACWSCPPAAWKTSRCPLARPNPRVRGSPCRR